MAQLIYLLPNTVMLKQSDVSPTQYYISDPDHSSTVTTYSNNDRINACVLQSNKTVWEMCGS